MSCALGAPAKNDPFFAKELRPMLETFCSDCHMDGATKGDFSMDDLLTPAGLDSHHHEWKGIMENLERHAMPPGKKKKPSQQDRDRMVAWLRDQLFPVDCEHPDPGRVTIRRLNVDEYNRTVSDIFGTPLTPGDLFPPDDTGYGYDTIGDVLSVSPLQWEKYMEAAEAVVKQIFPQPPAQPVQLVLGGGGLEGQGNAGSEFFSLPSRGDGSGRLKIPLAGKYKVEVVLHAQQAGPDPAQASLLIRKQPYAEMTVDTPSGEPKTFTFEVFLDAGNTDFGVRFLNDYYNPEKREDRNLYIDMISVSGPRDLPPPEVSPAYQKLMRYAEGKGSDSAKAHAIVKALIRKAWRKTPAATDVDPLMHLYDFSEREGHSFDESLALVVQAILISPQFLFRGEEGVPPGKPNRLLSEVELASRLSYFLWSSIPDDTLLDLAEKGQLRKNMSAQVKRMLQDPRGQALAENFAGQWLQLRKMSVLEPDPVAFTSFTRETRLDAAKETQFLFADILSNNRSALDLLDADYTFLNERLAKFYGVPDVTGEQFRKVALADSRRRGILTHASILTLTSNPNRTSPVHRGKFVLETILDTPPPPAPQVIPELAEAREIGPDATLRRRLEIHRDNPACAGCHSIMDPPGFAFEHFNAVGLWRDEDSGQPIDSKGELVSGETFDGHLEFIRWIKESRSEHFARNLSKNLLTFAIGRGMTYKDRCAVDKIIAKTRPNQYRLEDLVVAVIESVPFQYRGREMTEELTSR